MELTEIRAKCDKSHEKMFSWLMGNVFGEEVVAESDDIDMIAEVEGVSKFCEEVDKDQLDSLILSVACSSPGRFGEVFYRNALQFTIHEGCPNEPWRFYPEQWEAIEYEGDLIITAGAGAGKTRLFACKGPYVVAFRKSSVLIITHTETARGQIFNEMVGAIRRSPFLSSIFPESEIHRGHQKEIGTGRPGYGTIRFVLSGDGTQVQSLHIGRNGYIFCDEAAKYKDSAWPDILSRARLGCRLIIGSVSYGVSGNGFQRRLREATELRLMKMTNGRQLGDEIGKDDEIRMAKVRWSRREQPGWDDRMEAQAIRDHGPVEGAEFKRYVEGLDVDTEDLVFTREHLDKLFVRVPMYRTLRVVWDAENNLVKCSVWVAIDNIVVAQSTMVEHSRQEFSCKDFKIGDWVVDNIPKVPVDIGGVDAGKIQDLNVFGAFEDTGSGLRCRWTFVSMYLPWVIQSELIAFLYNYGVVNLLNWGVGIEASGYTIACSIWEALKWQYHVPASWLSPFTWETKVELTGIHNEPEWDRTRNRVRRKLKHHLTVRMKDMILNGNFELPACDGDFKTEFLQHGGSYSLSGFEYDDERDHYIEMCRVAVGRYLQVHGGVEIMMASRDAAERLTIPRDQRTGQREGPHAST